MGKQSKPGRQAPFAVEFQKVLHEQAFGPAGPGTVLRDFQTLLEFFGPEGIEVGSKNQLFRQVSLVQLNARMAQPIEIDMKRPIQKSFPNLNGLYLLLRASEMAAVAGAGSRHRLVLDPRVLDSWNKLNSTERYMSLLETWLLRANAEILGERAGVWDQPLFQVFEFYPRIPAGGLQVAGSRQESYAITFRPGLYNLALLGLFGLVSVDSSRPAPGGGWGVEAVRRTRFGDALLALIHIGYQEHKLSWLTGEEPGVGTLQPLLQPYFPQWKGKLETQAEPEPQDGVFVFKVSLEKDLWRQIAIPASAPVSWLANSILDAYRFDADHLYAFLLKDRKGRRLEVHHPYADGDLCAEDVRIGELPLRPGGSMVYWYDFGDNWKFGVKLERVDAPDPKLEAPKLLKSKGRAPRQYQRW